MLITNGASYITNTKTFWNTARGYNTAAKLVYLATNGNDSTCVANDISKPCATFYKATTLLSSGGDNMILIRGGTYTDFWYVDYAPTGVSGHPNIVASFPGELAINTGLHIEAVGGNDYWTFDTIQRGVTSSTNSGSGWRLKGTSNIKLIYTETIKMGVFGYDILPDSPHKTEYLTVERSIVRGCTSHNIYMQSGYNIGNNGPVTFDRFISYGSVGYEGIQFNGYWGHATIQKSIFHSNGQNGINFLAGVDNMTIKNNIFYRMDGGTDVAWSNSINYSLSFFHSTFGQSGNSLADPKFIDVSTSYYNAAGSFDFSIASDSPAVNFG